MKFQNQIVFLFNIFFRFLNKISIGFIKPLYIIKFRPTYDEDGLVTSHNSDFLKNDNFIRSYNLGFNTGSSYGWNIRWRIHIACFFAHYAKNLEGDFVECGTNKGMTSLSIIDNLDFKKVNKNFFLIDTFNGVVEQMLTKNEKEKTDTPIYNNCYNEVLNTFRDYDNVHVIKGKIPEVLLDFKIDKICFIHIDLNSSTSESLAINLLWDKVVKNGLILLDDYAYSGFSDTKKMWDSFSIINNVKILTLPTGQGIIIK
jgi:hypothetical protein